MFPCILFAVSSTYHHSSANSQINGRACHNATVKHTTNARDRVLAATHRRQRHVLCEKVHEWTPSTAVLLLFNPVTP